MKTKREQRTKEQMREQSENKERTKNKRTNERTKQKQRTKFKKRKNSDLKGLAYGRFFPFIPNKIERFSLFAKSMAKHSNSFLTLVNMHYNVGFRTLICRIFHFVYRKSSIKPPSLFSPPLRGLQLNKPPLSFKPPPPNNMQTS